MKLKKGLYKLNATENNTPLKLWRDSFSSILIGELNQNDFIFSLPEACYSPNNYTRVLCKFGIGYVLYYLLEEI